MARRRKRWRKWLGRVVGRTFKAAALLGALGGLTIALATGELYLALLLMPAMAAGAVVALPFILISLAIALLSMALPFAVLGTVFGGPFYVIHRLLSRAGGGGEGDDEEDLVGRLGPEGLLRRRYVAGELTYEQFRTGMLESLKGRFTRGEMNVTQYERELQALIEPARVLDTRTDPAVAGAVMRTS